MHRLAIIGFESQRFAEALSAVGSRQRLPETPRQATVRASAEELALWAWTRGGSVQASGQPAALAAMAAALSQGMP
jgi:hypothetical protein